jgi:hypothetical protein
MDPIGEAEEELANLKMQDNQLITKYNVEFNRLAAICKWDDAPLRHSYYRGLPTRIKDSLAHSAKPSNLRSLRSAAQSVDSRYWEHHAEISHEQPKSDKKSDNPSNKNSKSDKKPDKSPSSSSNNKSSDSKSKSDKKDEKKTNLLTDKLSKDGKLTPEERQRHFDNNLCLVCGKPGHVAKDCSCSALKAKAAKASKDAKKA